MGAADDARIGIDEQHRPAIGGGNAERDAGRFGDQRVALRPGPARPRAICDEDVGARVHGPVTQGDFLKRIGIDTRAAALMQKAAPDVATDISVALKRLTDTGRSGMGSMFKVLGISEPRLTGLAGLSDLEQAGGA